MSRFSMNEMTTLRWSLEDDVQQFAAAGFEGLGVWREKLSDCGLKFACELLADSGLSVSSLSWIGGFTGSEGRSHADALADAREAIEEAAQLRAGCLILHSGARGHHTNRHVRRLLHGALDALLPIAEKFGVTLALEPMHAGCAGGFTFLTDVQESLSIVRAFESQHLRLVLDMYHLAHDEAIFDQLPALMPHVALVQLGDAAQPPLGDPNRCLLGEGQLPILRMLGSLAELGYEGFLEVELLGEDLAGLEYSDILEHSRFMLSELTASAELR